MLPMCLDRTTLYPNKPLHPHKESRTAWRLCAGYAHSVKQPESGETTLSNVRLEQLLEQLVSQQAKMFNDAGVLGR